MRAFTTTANTAVYPCSKFRYVPAEYRILIRRENDKGRWDTASYKVGKERYDSIKIGDEVKL